MENENTPDDMRHTSVTQQNGIVKLTPFGKEFTQVCFSSCTFRPALLFHRSAGLFVVHHLLHFLVCTSLLR